MLDIGPREIHVWRIALDPPRDAVSALGTLLSDDERARARSFHFARHRRRFTVRRGALRSILGALVDRDPRTLRFDAGPRGKPFLGHEGARERPGANDLRFNLTDSADLALLAVCRGAELGVDVEQVRRSRDLRAIARSHFAAAERDALAALEGDRFVDGFYRVWTRKEAYLKAVGTGLHTPLDRFSVSIEADAPRFVDIDGSRDEAAAWTLYDLEPAPGFVGAVAIRRPGDEVVWRSLAPGAVSK